MLIRDANLCIITSSITITQPADLTATAAVTSDYNGRDISCNGKNDGEVTATAGGGTAPYTYEWFTDAALTALDRTDNSDCNQSYCRHILGESD